MMSAPNPELNISNDSDLSLDREQNFQESFAIVGVGASAGGLDAFTQLLHSLPNDTGMGFVLIQHLAPQYDSQLSEILQRTTQMPVTEAVEGMRIAPNNVYVIPPNTLMTLDQGVLRLEPRPITRGKSMAIDCFFSSLAADRGQQAIAVVLSGNNEDGTVGLGVIKSAGGTTFAQELDTAEFPTMPTIAIASGYVDFVLSISEIAAELVNISEKNKITEAEIDPNEPEDVVTGIFANNDEDLKIILDLLHKAMGVDFSHYKRGTIKRRISRRMGLLCLQELGDYAAYLQENSSEIEKLYNDILINVTSFFRDPEAFKALQEIAFPAICQHRSPELPIRVWVAGCSTGEEVYSIAMSLLEFMDDQPVKYPIQIFATDISEASINTARRGIYSDYLLTDVSPERLQRFFSPAKSGYQIGKKIRSLCIFARQNLTSDPPFSRLDLISCRNMLIYLEPVLQKKVMPIFHYALNANGFLLLGSAEGIGNATDLFEAVDKKNRLYKTNLTPTRIKFNFAKVDNVKKPHLLKSDRPDDPSSLEQLADQVVLGNYAPVGVIINGDLEILQFRGQTSQYLGASSGKASLNLLKMARPELVLELRSAIYDAKHQNTSIHRDGIELSQAIVVKLAVIPLKQSQDTYFLVLFESHPPSSPSSHLLPAAPKIEPRKTKQTEPNIEIAQLTHELAKTKQYLRSIIEAQEATNQELKIAGEEFLSTNEELQSANEELETAKEEIQATNEELSTINNELRDRNAQLHGANNDLQNLLRSVNISILMLSDDLKIRRFTPMAEQCFNLIASDVGRPFSDIQTNIDVDHIRALITEVIDSLIPYEQDVQDYAGRWYSLRILPYRTTDNRIDGVVISLIDIDLLKRNAIALEASRNYAAAIIATLRQPLLVLDADLRVITANCAFYQIFKMEPSQTEQQLIFEIGQGAWSIPQLRSLLSDILRLDITVQDYEITQNFAQIGSRTMLLNACRLDQANTGQMILIAIEDVTERNLQKQKLAEKQQELTEAMVVSDSANQAKSKFLGHISHELRTPLTAIMGFSQILQDSPNLDPDSKGFLDIICRAGEHLNSLIEDLLDISRIEAEKMAIEPSILSLANFLKVTVDMVSLKAIAKGLTLTTQFADDLPENIYADEKRLRQVLLNLLSNAIKFTSAGEITFSVNKIYSGYLHKLLIKFAIADKGVGIDANQFEKIFKPFEQVGTSTTKSQGTGLGLAISQYLVQKMGGKIVVDSEVGVGSTFSFALNLIEDQPQNVTKMIAAAPPN